MSKFRALAHLVVLFLTVLLRDFLKTSNMPLQNEKRRHYLLLSSCNENPLTPHFYIVKLGFTGVCIILFILL